MQVRSGAAHAVGRQRPVVLNCSSSSCRRCRRRCRCCRRRRRRYFAVVEWRHSTAVPVCVCNSCESDGERLSQCGVAHFTVCVRASIVDANLKINKHPRLRKHAWLVCVLEEVLGHWGSLVAAMGN